jgi:hypothetical protein
MGTTSPKGLRYPEPTVEARTLHTQIKNLADDVNGVLTTHDTRMNGLDTKTNTTNNNLVPRALPEYRYGNVAGVYTHSPNDGIIRTISQHTDQFYVHPSANTLQISVSQVSTANNPGGSAGVWQVLVNFAGTGWTSVPGNDLRVHNHEQPMLDMGFHVVGTFNVQAYRGQLGSIATNFTNDATSGGWVSHGPMMWSVVSLT